MTMSCRTQAELISHACKIAEELGAPVFPVRVDPDPHHPGKTIKRPLIKGWQNGGADTNPESIETLFNQHPHATHVGLLTGDRSRILVIDLDGEPGVMWWREHTDLLPATRTQRTRRDGGKHLIYRIPAGCRLRNSASKIAPGVDIRADGGFVVDWSSEYPPEVEDLTDATPALIEFLQRAGSKAAPVEASGSDSHFPEGQRNDALARVAGKLRRSGLEGDELESALLAVNARRCDPPLAESEVAAIAKSMARYALGPETASPTPWTPPAVNSYGGTFDPAAIPQRQWLIRGRYALGEGTAIAGPPGTNKSSLLLADAVQLVTGRSLFGETIDKGGNHRADIRHDAQDAGEGAP